MQIYLVGGAVRDRLLNRPVKEKDWVVVGSTPTEMTQHGFRPVGKDFPVFLHPDTHEEYALARTERKTAAGYRGFKVYASPEVTLEEDLARRDLTVNAMAEDENGQVIDPYNGLDDLDERKLRHVSPAFAEDPVRILRVARFAARYAYLGFHVADDTLALMSNMVSNGEVDALVPERVWQETAKALSENTPSVFFDTLRQCGALERLFPEINALFGVPQPEQYHPEIDTGVHCMMVVDAAAQLSDDIDVRFAALCHDLGKGETPEELWPKHHGHEQKSARLTRELCQRLRVPNETRDLAAWVAEYHGHVHKAQELRDDTALKVIESADAFRKPERFAKALMACEADSRGRSGFEDKPYPPRGWFTAWLSASKQVDIKPLLDQGIKGEKLKNAIRRERVAAIKRARSAL